MPHIFTNLAALYMKPSVILSQQSLIGLLLTSEESHTNMCGTVLPVSVLTRWCRELFTMESLKVSVNVLAAETVAVIGTQYTNACHCSNHLP